MEFEEIQEIEEDEQYGPANLNAHFKNKSGSFLSIQKLQSGERDQREGGEFLDYDGYHGDGAYLSTSHCNIQADDSFDSDYGGA